MNAHLNRFSTYIQEMTDYLSCKQAKNGKEKSWIKTSPLSLTIEGADYLSNENSLEICNFLLKLKDGSTVKQAATGGGGSQNVYDNTFYTYLQIVSFEAPVNPDDVAKIRIWNDNTSFDLWIPVEY